MRKLFPVKLCIVFFILLIAACENNASFKIGLMAPFSGSASAFGAIALSSAQLALETINEAGGINGHPVELLIQDYKSNPESAGLAAEALIDYGVEAIIGPYTSALVPQALQVCNTKQVLLFSPTVASSLYTGIDDMFFRFYTPAFENGKRAAEKAAISGITSAAILWDSQNNEYSTDWRGGFRSQFENLDGNIVADIELHRDPDLDLHKLAEEALKESPAAVVFILTGFHTASMAQEIRKHNTETVFFSAEWAAGSADLIHLGGSAIEGMIMLHPVKNTKSSPLYSQFMDQYINRFSPPVLLTSISTYDVVRLICKARETQTTGQELKESLIQLKEFNGILQRLQIDPKGDIPVLLEFHTIKNGHFVPMDGS